jgi:pimeloyl-ACP methyl ester carboxylesterase
MLPDEATTPFSSLNSDANPIAVAGLMEPFVKAIRLPHDGLYGRKDDLDFILQFNEKVTVDTSKSRPTIPIEVNYAMREAVYSKGSGSKRLTFTWQPGQADRDSNGITLGRVDPITGQRDFDFSNSIANYRGINTSDHIPTTDTSAIRIDGQGPVVSSFKGPTIKSGRASVKVQFDRDVTVAGNPEIPVLINGKKRFLRLSKGNNSNTLLFEANAPKNGDIRSATFVPGTGEVILLGDSDSIRDSQGNRIQTLKANFGEELIISNSKAVLLGSHFEFLQTITAEELNALMDSERAYYFSGATINPSLPPTSDNLIPYLKDFNLPDYRPATHNVDVYRVAYRSQIPQQNRYITNYGIAAIPQTDAEALPLISWEHQTVTNKRSAVSQAFSYPQQDFFGLTLTSGRLKIAHHAGQGFAVISSDPYGLGNSLENYAYVTKKSNQQSSLDNYRASLKLLDSLNKSVSALFLGGWSSGGVSAMGFAEKLEEEHIDINGVAITGGPLDLEMTINSAIWNPRDGSDGNTPEAPWFNYILTQTAFALSSYEDRGNVAEKVLGKYYEAGRKIYTSDYTRIEPAPNGSGILVDGLFLPTSLKEILSPAYATNKAAFAQSDYVQLLRESSSGRLPITADLLMIYGDQDEVVPNPVSKSLHDWQVINYGKQNIDMITEKAANHRGAFFTMLHDSLPWFFARTPNRRL